MTKGTRKGKKVSETKTKVFAIRSSYRWEKAYFSCYTEAGKLVISREKYRTLSDAIERGKQLQTEVDKQALAEGRLLKAKLLAMEATIDTEAE